jgi:hypothetical protein
MRRKPGDGITEEARADYQSRIIDLVNDLLDSTENRVDVEFVQHRGDIGHEDTDEISSHYGIVKLPVGHQITHERLIELQKLAAGHNAKVSIGVDAALWFWVPSAEKGGNG